MMVIVSDSSEWSDSDDRDLFMICGKGEVGVNGDWKPIIPSILSNMPVFSTSSSLKLFSVPLINSNTVCW